MSFEVIEVEDESLDVAGGLADFRCSGIESTIGVVYVIPVTVTPYRAFFGGGCLAPRAP